MRQCIRTTSANTDFQRLVKELDAHLAIINGDENDFFAQFNTIENMAHVVVAYDNNVPVGCGAIKEYEPGAMEVKRMFVPAERRGQGIAVHMLNDLETWAKELGFEKCILETSLDLKPAISLYTKSGYSKIPNYGQYKDVQTSICFEKLLNKR